MRVRIFSLSLTGTAFSWFSSLAPNSIRSWDELEHKFHHHFYGGDNETKLTVLTSVRQGRDESIDEYFKRFKYIKTDALICHFLKRIWSIWLLQVYVLVIEKTLDGSSFYSINQLQAKALLTFLSAITRNGVVKPIPGNGARNACFHF